MWKKLQSSVAFVDIVANALMLKSFIFLIKKIVGDTVKFFLILKLKHIKKSKYMKLVSLVLGNNSSEPKNDGF